jgi:type I restriction enzyme S subunit
MPRAVESGIPYISTKDFYGDNQIDFEGAKRISPEDYTALTRKIIPEQGDILLSRYGTIGEVRKVSTDAPFQASYSIAIIKTLHLPELVDYLLYALRSAGLQEQMRRHIRASSQPDLGLEYIRQLEISLAPLAEHQRIVAAIEQQFTRLDAGVAALKSAQTRLKRYRAAVLKAAVEGKLTEAWRAEHPDTEPASVLLQRILAERRARWGVDMRMKGKDPAKVRYEESAGPDTTDLPALPEGWCWASVEQLTNVVGGVTKGRNLAGRSTVELPYLRVANVQRGFLDLEIMKTIEVPTDEIDRYLLHEGDVVLTEGGDADKLGRAALWQGQIQPCIHQNHIFRARLIDQRMPPQWLVTYANSEQGQAYFLEASKQTTNLASINLTQLRNCPVPLPSLVEQERIIAEVERRLSVVSELEATVEANLKRAERLRQSILREAFAGRLVHQDPNDEPASVLLERIRRERATKQNKERVPVFIEARQVERVAAEQVSLWDEE